MTENQAIIKIKYMMDLEHMEELKLFIRKIIDNNAITYEIINIFNETEYDNKKIKLFIFNEVKRKQRDMELEIDQIKIINNDLRHNYCLQQHLIFKYKLKEKSWSDFFEKCHDIKIDHLYIEDFLNITFMLNMKTRRKRKDALKSFYNDYDLKNDLLLKDVTMFKMNYLFDIFEENYKNIDFFEFIKNECKNIKYLNFIKNICKLKNQKNYYASFKESILFLEYFLRSELKKENININIYKRKEKEDAKKEIDEFTKWLQLNSDKKPSEIKKIKEDLLENEFFNETNTTENTILLNELVNESGKNNLISEDGVDVLKYLLLSDEGQGLNLRNLIFHGLSNEKFLMESNFFKNKKSFEFLTLIVIYQIFKIIIKRGENEK